MEYHLLTTDVQRKLLQFMADRGFENRMNITATERTIGDYIFTKKGFRRDVKLKNIVFNEGPYLNGTFKGINPANNF